MIDLSSTIERIKSLLSQNTPQSVTYAALESRLALEKVCYDRLRQRHDYISNSDLKKWQPHYVINTLMAEVDPNVGQTMSLWIAKSDNEDPKDDDFVHIGTEIGVDATQISKLWNAVSNLALHVRIPDSKDDKIGEYGDHVRIESKVREIVTLLEKLAQGRFTYSGYGEEVSFTCNCGQIIRRRCALLKPEQSINCFNYHCNRSYIVVFQNDGSLDFKLDSLEIPCRSCNEILLVPRREIETMRYSEVKTFLCGSCRETTDIALLVGVQKPPEELKKITTSQNDEAI